MKSLTTDTVENWFTEELHSITHDRSSIYTKDNVLDIISILRKNILQEATDPEVIVINTPSVVLSSNDITHIANKVSSEISGNGVDIVEDYELTMNYHEVELDSIELDENLIQDLIQRIITDYINNLETERNINS
jgi:hypothetical protein